MPACVCIFYLFRVLEVWGMRIRVWFVPPEAQNLPVFACGGRVQRVFGFLVEGLDLKV